MNKYIFANDDNPFKVIDDIAEKGEAAERKLKEYRGKFTKDTPGGTELQYYTEFNELANLFKDTFHVTDPTFTDAEMLRQHFLNTPLSRDPQQILQLITQLKRTLTAVSGFQRLEPNIAQLLGNFTIQLMDRTRDGAQVKQKLADLEDKANDTENPKDAYIIALLNGNYATANLMLLLSNAGKVVSKQTLQDISSNQQLANQMLGAKSSELLNAQYLDNELALVNATEIEKSLAAYQALIPMAVQRAKWQQQLNQFSASMYKNPAIKAILASPVITMLGAAIGGGENFDDFTKAPLNTLFQLKK